MPNIRLEPVTVHNWLECIHLSLLEGQKDLVPSNLYSIAEAQFYPEARPLVIYNELDQMVGFIMYGRDIFSGKWKIFRLMVAATYQGNGYGRAAMLHILAEISQKPDGQEILVCYQDRNHIARKLYAQLGFLEQTLDEKGVITAQYKRPAGKA